MSFGVWTQVGPRYPVLDGAPDPRMRRGKFDGASGLAQDIHGHVGPADSLADKIVTMGMPIGVYTLALSGQYN